MSRKTLKAVLAGASGMVGGECLQCLLDHPEYGTITVLTRRDLGTRMRSRKIRQLVTDFDELGLHSKDLQADHVFCALGTTIKKAGSQAKFRQVDYDYPLALARITLAEGARHFSLVSALGASVSSPFFYSRVKGELERALQEMDWPGLGIVRPSVIAGERAESRPMERLSERLLRFAPPTWRPVEARDIARSMVAVALAEPPGLTIVESREIPGRAAQLA
jgi:uncharacterized protein YbjT (DUF2867 family)